MKRFLPSHGGYRELLSYQKSEIKLTSVARASLEELLLDYRDFLRARKLQEWDKNHAYVKHLRKLNRINPTSYEIFRKGIEHQDPSISANVIIGLIKVVTYLLDQQIKSLETDFIKNGGLRERMTKARLSYRSR